MTEMYRGLKIEKQGYGWSASDENADAEFVDGMWRVSGGLFFTSIGPKQNLLDQIDEHFADKANLTWEFCDGGTWTAFSETGEAANPFLWRIVVCEDGTFDVNESDSELQPAFEVGSRKVPTFKSLNEAKNFCEESEVRCIQQQALNAKCGRE